jgi:hypothetical protein
MDASYRRAGTGSGSAPRSVEDIYKDYRARRSAILRALTHGTRPLPRGSSSRHACGKSPALTLSHFSRFADVEEFYALCDPGESPSPRDLSAPWLSIQFGCEVIRSVVGVGCR